MRGKVRWPKKNEVLIVLQKEINRKPLGSQNQILRCWREARVGVDSICTKNNYFFTTGFHLY